MANGFGLTPTVGLGNRGFQGGTLNLGRPTDDPFRFLRPRAPQASRPELLQPRQTQQAGFQPPSFSGTQGFQNLFGGGGAAAPAATGAAQAPAAVSGGFPSSGAFGVGSGMGGAPGGAAAASGGGTAGGGAAGGGGGAAAFAPALGYAFLIGLGKTIETRTPDSPVGRGLLSGLGPSIPQMIEDPKLAGFAAAGVPFLGGIFRSDEAAETESEFEPIFGPLFGALGF